MPRLTQAAFEQRVNAVFGNTYDISRTIYHDMYSHLEIRCLLHGIFRPLAVNFLSGHGCPACAQETRNTKRRLSSGEFIRRCREIHGDIYDYTYTAYIKSTLKVSVVCKQHGSFEISPIKHLYSAQGCPQCAVLTRGHRVDIVGASRKTANTKIARYGAKFIIEAQAVHGDCYDYSKAVYMGRTKKIIIICTKHGEFLQSPYRHIKTGQGCPQCSHHQSKGETAIGRYLGRILGQQVELRNRQLIGPKELDIYLPKKLLAVEYCGEYHHSQEHKMDALWNTRRHKEKHDLCAAKGIRLITVFEGEWLTRQRALKRLLRHAVGKGRGQLFARKCVVRPVPLAEAQAFFERYHPQGGNGYGTHYGLYYGKHLVACMRFTFGANDRGVGAQERVWTLSRYASSMRVTGGASRLFTAFVRSTDPAQVKSFSDNRYFTGEMYLKLGFVLDAELSPDYQVWSPRLGLLPKSHYQRRHIQQRLRDHGLTEQYDHARDVRTEAEMTQFMKCGRLYDCGKKRWIWLKPV